MFPHLESIRSHPLTGMSTGHFTVRYPQDEWEALINKASVYQGAIELSALSGKELPSLIEYLTDRDRLPFSYISIHAPSFELPPQGFSALVPELLHLPEWVESIVIHPDVIDDPEILSPLGRRAVLENMDNRKRTGITPHDLAILFNALPEAGFCLDLNHVLVVDPTMQLGHQLIDSFSSRLRQFHISGVSATKGHAKLTEGEARTFSPFLARSSQAARILEEPLVTIPSVRRRS